MDQTEIMLAVSVVLNLLITIIAGVSQVVKASGEARTAYSQARTTERMSGTEIRHKEMELADRIREVTGELIADLRAEILTLQKEKRDMDKQVDDLFVQVRTLKRESEKFRCALEDSLQVTKSALRLKPNSAESSALRQVVVILEKELKPPIDDTKPLPSKDGGAQVIGDK